MDGYGILVLRTCSTHIIRDYLDLVSGSGAELLLDYLCALFPMSNKGEERTRLLYLYAYSLISNLK